MRESKKLNLSQMDIEDAGGSPFIRKFRIGTRFVDELGTIHKYVKVDFGVAGKHKGKTIRNIRYMWVPVRL